MLRQAFRGLRTNIVYRRPVVLRNVRLASSKVQNAQAPPIATYRKIQHKPEASPPPPPTAGSTASLPASPKGSNWDWKLMIFLTKWITFVFLAGHIFVEYFYLVSSSYGISMLPTISSCDDWLCISKYYRRGRGIEVGDLVSFQIPITVGESAVKRVIGLEGDFVLMNTPEKSGAMIQVGVARWRDML